MAEAPGQAVLDDIADVAAARGDARNRRDMVGLERMLHAEQKSQSQNSEHFFLRACASETSGPMLTLAFRLARLRMLELKDLQQI